MSDKPVQLSLDIFNVKGGQPLKVKTTQLFNHRGWIEKTHTVPVSGNTTLTFDITKNGHKNIRVVYENIFNPLELRDPNNYAKKVSIQNYGASYADQDASGKYTRDINQDGKIKASQSVYTSGGYFVLDRLDEDVSGLATPSIALKPVKICRQNPLSTDVTFSSGVYDAHAKVMGYDVYNLKAGETAYMEFDSGFTMNQGTGYIVLVMPVTVMCSPRTRCDGR